MTVKVPPEESGETVAFRWRPTICSSTRGIALPVPPRKSRAQLEAQGIFEHVSEHIRREPAQSTRLLEAWIGSSEEAE